MREFCTPLYSFRGCSNCACVPKYVLNIKCFPTTPLEFASPFGKLEEWELSSSRAVSAPFAQRTTARARCRCSCFLESKYATPCARPCAFSSTRATSLFGRISHRPVASASGSMATMDVDLAPYSHRKKKQKPHAWHAKRPLYGMELM